HVSPPMERALATTRARPAPRVGVVLAAGRAERLSKVTRGRPKALVLLGGLPLVERAVRSLLAAGIERVVVVSVHQGLPVRESMANISPEQVRRPVRFVGSGARG